MSCPLKDYCHNTNIFKKVSDLSLHMSRKHYCSSSDNKFVKCDNENFKSLSILPTSQESLNNDDSSEIETKTVSKGAVANEMTNINELSLKMLSSTYITALTKQFISEKSLQTIIEAFLDLDKLNSQ